MQEKWQEIITRIIAGDQEAFREVVEYYQHQAFSLTFRILGNEEEAKDAVQEGFIKLWQNIKSYNPANKFTSWMYRIMANCAIDRYRKLQRQNEVTINLVPETSMRSFYGDPNTSMDNQEIARMIRLLAGKLPEKQQLVFILRDIQGMESAEVQTVLGISETNVKSNLHHARKSIREKIDRIFQREKS
ncbi:MAG: RNA polymerase sigma factor [Bacteroidales bacterium]|nr:RNA polymerase sigma factor [Bacteroidales bacterium]